MHEVPWKILPYHIASSSPPHHTRRLFYHYAHSLLTRISACTIHKCSIFLLHLHITLNPSVILLCNHPPSMFVSCQTLQKKMIILPSHRALKKTWVIYFTLHLIKTWIRGCTTTTTPIFLAIYHHHYHTTYHPTFLGTT